MSTEDVFLGSWAITEMEPWDRDAFGFLGPAARTSAPPGRVVAPHLLRPPDAEPAGVRDLATVTRNRILLQDRTVAVLVLDPGPPRRLEFAGWPVWGGVSA